jgi:hypothetical protein
MLISLNEYAAIHGKTGDNIRRLVEKGVFKTAKKIGRNWIVDSEEPYPVTKRSYVKKKTSIPNCKNLINYLVICVSEFAERFSTNDKQAYQYLAQYGGISFLTEHYEIEHTLSLDDAIDDITLICHNNGGDL